MLADAFESLHLKSAPDAPSSTGLTDGNAVLCTPNQTFDLRNVQTSNILYILESSSDGPLDAEDNEPSSSPSVIGQCQAILELIEAKTAPLEHLRQCIPLATSEGLLSSNALNRQLLLAQAPFSSGEFNRAWVELCIIEGAHGVFLPTPKMLKETWLALLSEALLKGLDLTKPFETKEIENLRNDDQSSGVFEAVLSRLRINEAVPDGSEFATTAKHSTSHQSATILLDEVRAVPWVGSTVLHVHDRETVAVDHFMEEWKDLLPENWRALARIELLAVSLQCPRDCSAKFGVKGEYVTLDSGFIKLKTNHEQNRSQNEARPISSSSKVSSKWHDRFRSNR